MKTDYNDSFFSLDMKLNYSIFNINAYISFTFVFSQIYNNNKIKMYKKDFSHTYESIANLN